jgi:hypothetical protein
MPRPSSLNGLRDKDGLVDRMIALARFVSLKKIGGTLANVVRWAPRKIKIRHCSYIDIITTFNRTEQGHPQYKPSPNPDRRKMIYQASDVKTSLE